MANDEKPTKINDLVVMLVLGFLIFALFGNRLPTPVWVLLGIAVFGLWWLFLMPTKCDTVLRTDRTRLCIRNVRGKLRGCEQWHSRDKRDAVFAALLRMRNPGMMFRMMWAPPQIVPGGGNVSNMASSRKATYDATMLLLTVIGTVAGVASAVFTALS
jgi:hypothetical protein